jgi:hypothetical protein
MNGMFVDALLIIFSYFKYKKWKMFLLANLEGERTDLKNIKYCFLYCKTKSVL